MTSIPKVRPAYISPLTDKQHAQLGRICILWGQIDLNLDQLLRWAYGFSKAQWDAMEIADRPLGTKLTLLKKSLENVGDLVVRQLLEELCEALDNVKAQRNHAIHGMWGWRVDAAKGTVEPCARFHKSPALPLKVQHLSLLERALCHCSNIAMRAFLYSQNSPPSEPLVSARFFHGKETEHQEVLSKWLEQVRPDDATLDRNFLEGQLPRLGALLPTK
jgi:hypothetical protein